jgi:uncharacterized protein YkwD
MKHAAVMLAAILLAALAAIGISAVDPPSAKAAGGGYVKKCGGGRIFLKAKEKKTFIRHNEIRRDHNLPTLCVHPDLQRAARAHSKSMIRHDYFSHNSRNGDSFEQRLRKFGYNTRRHYPVGENIYGGGDSYGKPASAIRSWMNSSGHRTNILKRAHRQIGIGTASGRYHSYNGWTMYTADFGGR